jgi:hypothetical protein
MPKASGYLHFMKRPTPKKLPLPIDYSIRAVVYRTKHTYSWWVIFEPYGRNAMTTGLPSLHIIETLKLPNTSRVSPALGWAIPTVRNRPLLAQGRQYRKGRSSAFVKLSKKVEKARESRPLMYTIGKVSEGIILICRDCGHIEHVCQFNVNLGTQRTQAARAMQAHVLEQHNTPLLTRLPKNYGLMAQSRW